MNFIELLRSQKRNSFIFSSILKARNIEVISRNQLINQAEENVKTFFFGNSDMIAAGTATCIGRLPRSISVTSSYYESDYPFVSEISDILLVGKYATCFNASKNIISEVNSPPYADYQPRIYDLYSSTDIPTICCFEKDSPVNIKSACSLVTKRSQKYFHWFLDCLTRLEGYEFYCKRTGHKPVLVVDSKLKIWQQQSLEMLGYNENDLLAWRGDELAVDSLIVPSFRQTGNWISPLALKWLRCRILEKLDKSYTLDKNERFDEAFFSERIYISRAHAKGRRIINDDQVFDALKKFGFKKYFLEDLSFYQQVYLFKKAKIVISPHGAGLTNIIFSSRISVIEFVNPDVSPHYFLISKILGFSYFCMDCISARNSIANSLRGRSDMIVDLNQLELIVKELV